MDAEIIKQLDHINRKFYQDYSKSFSQTRGKLQPGVSAVLGQIAHSGNWLDVGCGNGNLAHAWAQKGYIGKFCGVDFSPGLIADAGKSLLPERESQTVCFIQADLTREDWFTGLPDIKWDGLFCFAVLHHIPGKTRRMRLCSDLKRLLDPNGFCYVSVWQPNNSPRLIKKIQLWESVGLSADEVEQGDVLMDWRAREFANENHIALRYVHVFEVEELTELARNSGFSVVHTEFSDGKEGNLGLYQKWAVKI